MLFKYSLKGLLTEFKINFKPTQGFVNYIKSIFPFQEENIKAFSKDDFRTELQKQDLSFKIFWDTYAYKKGDKTKVQNLWKLLSDIDKAKALIYIPRYRNECLLNNTAFLYPERYLSRRIYNNE